MERVYVCGGFSATSDVRPRPSSDPDPVLCQGVVLPWTYINPSLLHIDILTFFVLESP